MSADNYVGRPNYWKNEVTFRVDPTQNGQLAAVFDFCYI